jgi:Na+/H+ antiporter NhaC
MENEKKNILSFTAWSDLSDLYRGIRKKTKRGKLFKVITYPVYLIFGLFFSLALVSMIRGFKNARLESERKRDLEQNYRKVIKKGILFTTMEYHQR